MKKIMSILLTVTMLLTMISGVIVNVSAADAVDGAWSFTSDLVMPNKDVRVIPITVKSAASNGTTVSGSSLSVSDIRLDSFVGDAYFDQSSIGSFEIIGEFIPTKVSSFVLRGSWNWAQRTDLKVSLRKAGTEEWVTINPHGLSGKQGGAYVACTLPDSLANQVFDQVKLTNNKDRVLLYGAEFFADSGWSVSSTLSLPTDAYVIPITVTSASTTTDGTAEVNWGSVPLDSLGINSEAGRHMQQISVDSTPFEMIGTFAEPTTVSSFILRSNSAYPQRSQVKVAFRNVETNEWVTVDTHSRNDKNSAGQYVTCDLSDVLGDQLFDQVRLTKAVADGYLELNGALFFTKNGSGLHSVSATATDSSNTFASAWGYHSASQLNKEGVAGALHSTVARLSAPTEIHSVKVTLGANSARANGSTVWASVDGIEWDQLSSLVEVKANAVNSAVCTSAATATKAYNYVKVEQASFKAGNWWSLASIAVYGWTRTAGDYVPATATADSNETLASLWNSNNTSNKTLQGSAAAPVSTVAKLEYSTVINAITIKTATTSSFANRIRNSVIYGSVDGKEWKKIGELGGGFIYNTLYTIPIDSTEAFNYVKVQQSDATANTNSYWTATRIAVYGDHYDGISMEGFQIKMDTSTYSVRFVSNVKGLEYQSVGYTISAQGEGVNKEWTVNDSVVYSSIYETVDGVSKPVYADEDCYFYVADVTNISIAKYDQIAFTVTPYAVLEDGSVLVGEAVTYALTDGVYINA